MKEAPCGFAFCPLVKASPYKCFYRHPLKVQPFSSSRAGCYKRQWRGRKTRSGARDDGVRQRGGGTLDVRHQSADTKPARHEATTAPCTVTSISSRTSRCTKQDPSKTAHNQDRGAGAVVMTRDSDSDTSSAIVRWLSDDKIGDSPIKSDLKLGQETHFGAKSQSEGTIQLVSGPRKWR